jgi:hypothetical protein
MSDLKRRLSALARQLGCHVHGAPLSCRTCEAPKPLPAPLSMILDDLINTVVARVGTEALRALVGRVPPPPQLDRPCRHCGGARQCGACQTRYAQAVFGAIGLTADEQRVLDDLMATCRRLDRARPRPWGRSPD